MKHLTQRDKVRQLLEERAGEWVPCYLLAAISLQYNARVYELRAEGFEILNSTQRRTDGAVYSWFKHPGQLSLFKEFSGGPVERTGHELGVR